LITENGNLTPCSLNPNHLLAALTALHVDADRAVMVEDHPLDMKVGQEAGVYAIGVLTGSGNRSTLTEAGAR